MDPADKQINPHEKIGRRSSWERSRRSELRQDGRWKQPQARL